MVIKNVIQKSTLFSAILIILFTSCVPTPVDDIGANINLIANPSFETSKHLPDYRAWKGKVYLQDSLGNQIPPLVQGAPDGGGVWSVQLEPLWYPEEGFTETGFHGPAGTNIYKVSAWIKTINWTGTLSLEQWRNGQKIAQKKISDTSVNWKQLSFFDTLSVVPSDSLKVHLSAGSTEVASGKVLFDLVSAEIIE